MSRIAPVAERGDDSPAMRLHFDNIAVIRRKFWSDRARASKM
jgi:hypothetical protein